MSILIVLAQFCAHILKPFYFTLEFCYPNNLKVIFWGGLCL
jgi:hypothetical protein